MSRSAASLQACRCVRARRSEVRLTADCHQVKKQAEHAPGGRQRREQRRRDNGKHDELIHARVYRTMPEKSYELPTLRIDEFQYENS